MTTAATDADCKPDSPAVGISSLALFGMVNFSSAAAALVDANVPELQQLEGAA